MASEDINWTQRFWSKGMKPLPKKVLERGAPPSTWVRVKWQDRDDTIVLIIDRDPANLRKMKGSFALTGYDPYSESTTRFESDQVVELVANLQVPVTRNFKVAPDHVTIAHEGKRGMEYIK